MDNRPVALADKWERLRVNGFEWGTPKPPPPPNPYDPFPAIVRPEPQSVSCWIKHKSWNFKLTVKQYVKPGMTSEDLYSMWFETFDRFLDVRNVDAFQAAKFVMESYGIWKKHE